MKKKLSKKELFKKYIKFIARPEDERPPSLKTISDFASTFDLTAQDIGDFETDPDFQIEVHNETINWARKKTPQLLAALYKKITTGRAKSTDITQWMALLTQAKYQTELLQFNFYDQLTQKQYEELERIISIKKSNISETS